MIDLLLSLKTLLDAVLDVLVSLTGLLWPLLPLLAWIGFWLFAVNWVRLRQVLLSGGWIAMALMGLLAILIWGAISPPPDGAHHLLGLSLSNYVGKTVYVTSLFVIMLLCGSVQLSGACGNCCRFEDETREPLAH